MGHDREENWFIVRKTIPTLDAETKKCITELGAQIGGGWHEIHTHIYIDPINQNSVKAELLGRGYQLEALSETKMCHPEGACKLVFKNSDL